MLSRQRYSLPARAGGGGPTPAAASPIEEGKIKLAEASRQMRFVEGKTFFQNENQWVDSAIQKARDARRVRVQFAV
jgi:hypothetical protein